MALKGLRVLEFAGLAPGPFCGMILADHGAKVIRIDGINAGIEDKLCRGKRSIAVNLKEKEGIIIVKKLSRISDVLIEPYRPGVMEKLGVGPKDLMSENKRLIYARLTGYGQEGVLAKQGGHDINYVAMSGMLSRIGELNADQMLPPINFLADMAGGGLTCALGILLALHQRHATGRGLIIDANMVEGAAYAGSFVSQMINESNVLNNKDGIGILDGSAHFYRTYKTRDNRFMAVGAIEPKFYANFLKGLDLLADETPQFPPSPQLARKISQIFATKTLMEWINIFEILDACVTPVLTLAEAAHHPHNRLKNTFATTNDPDAVAKYIPNPVPRLRNVPPLTKAVSNNPDENERDAVIDNSFVMSGRDSIQILKELGYSDDQCQQLSSASIIRQANLSKL